MTAATKRRPRPGRTLPTEIKVLVPGHARGAAAFIAMRRKGSLWCVVDSNRGDRDPDYWDGRQWSPLTAQTAAVDAYRWPQGEAQGLCERFAAQAAEIHRSVMQSSVAFHRDLAEARNAEAEQVTEVAEVTPPSGALAQANAAVMSLAAKALTGGAAAIDIEETSAALAKVRTALAEVRGNMSARAPKDVDGFGVTSDTAAATVRDASLADLAETDEDLELLTRLGRSIPATAEPDPEAEAEESAAEVTAVVDTATVRDLAGLGDTTTMPVLADVPPMPEQPPAATPEPALA